MSLFEKVMDKLGLYDDDYDLEEEDEQLREGEPQKADSSVPPEFLQHLQKKEKRSILPPVSQESAVKKVETKVETKVEAKPKRSFFDMNKQDKEEKKAVDELAKAMHVVISHPKKFDDCKEIVGYIQKGRSVIIDYDEADTILARRINDFVCGAVFAQGGNIKRISEKSFFYAPQNVDVENRSNEGFDD